MSLCLSVSLSLSLSAPPPSMRVCRVCEYINTGRTAFGVIPAWLLEILSAYVKGKETRAALHKAKGVKAND